jgi:hypothetical protein
MRWTLAAIVLSGAAALCGCRRESKDPVALTTIDASAIDDAGAVAGLVCVPDPSFPAVLDVPEASAAAEVELRRGTRELLVVADSENHGAALAYALPDGPARPVTLPLDVNVGDDVEGLAWRGKHLYALVSSGYVERFTPDGKGGVTRDGPAYPLGAPPYANTPLSAEASEGMPGTPPDFEGLCLRPATSVARCAGYAASRAYGWLVCLVFDGEKLRVDPIHPRIALDLKKHSLSDCAFGAADGPARDAMLVATNIYGGSTVYRFDETTKALTPIDIAGTANDEGVAVDHEGRLYQLMDANSSHSPSARAICTGW